MNIIELVSKDIKVPPDILIQFSKTSPHRYKVFKIKKRSGGDRIIAQPSSELKMIQRSIMKLFLKNLPIHCSAQAYISGRSIKSNIRAHLNCKYLLKMDFKNFFPSIKPLDFQKYLDVNNYVFDQPNMDFLLKSLFYRNFSGGLELSIGAPSSPIISNIIMYEFDDVMTETVKTNKTVYTRYADDLAFSTDEPNQLNMVQTLVEETLCKIDFPKLAINEKKTVHVSKKYQRRITGLILNSENKVSIGRDKKRLISSKVHRFSLKLLEDKEVISLQGYLAFIKDVEPIFLDALKKRYGEETISSIFRSNNKYNKLK